MSMSESEWIVSTIWISTEDGRAPVPGWHDGLFGIDWRPHDEGRDPAYVITHLGTGWSMFAMLANLENVQEAVKRLEERFDWSGADLCELRARIAGRRSELRAFVDEIDGLNPADFLPPPVTYRIVDPAK